MIYAENSRSTVSVISHELSKNLLKGTKIVSFIGHLPKIILHIFIEVGNLPSSITKVRQQNIPLCSKTTLVPYLKLDIETFPSYVRINC